MWIKRTSTDLYFNFPCFIIDYYEKIHYKLQWRGGGVKIRLLYWSKPQNKCVKKTGDLPQNPRSVSASERNPTIRCGKLKTGFTSGHRPTLILYPALLCFSSGVLCVKAAEAPRTRFEFCRPPCFNMNWLQTRSVAEVENSWRHEAKKHTHKHGNHTHF